MRHSDPKLTAQIYTDASLLPTFDAVQALPWIQEGAGSKKQNPPLIAPLKLDSDEPFLSRLDSLREGNAKSEVVDLEVISLKKIRI